DADLVVTINGGREIAEEIRIDVGRQRDLGLAEIEVALAWTDLTTTRNESGDLVGIRILRGAQVVAGENDRHRRIERGGGIRSCAGWGRHRLGRLWGARSAIRGRGGEHVRRHVFSSS